MADLGRETPTGEKGPLLLEGTTRPFGDAPPLFLVRRHMHRVVPLFVFFGAKGGFVGGRAVRLLAGMDGLGGCRV